MVVVVAVVVDDDDDDDALFCYCDVFCWWWRSVCNKLRDCTNEFCSFNSSVARHLRQTANVVGVKLNIVLIIQRQRSNG
jgi:hypothetical protein